MLENFIQLNGDEEHKAETFGEILDNQMKPSEVCKAAGLKSLAELVRTTGVSDQTLINWHRNKPKLFAVVVAGAVAMRDR